jgi:pimeloyl-ACP methyl ester carboxylesterase
MGSSLAAVFATLLLAGCSGAAPAPVAATPAAPPDAGLDAGEAGAPVGFLSDEPRASDGGGVVVDDVTYLSGTLVIHGRVCRPAGAGRHPLILLDHGGFVGIDADPTATEACGDLARIGIVAAMSEYRGEGGSDGAVEVCLGEVDDVLAMKAVMVVQPYVDAARVATVGFSHGACIATMTALRDPTLRAAVDFFGPADVGAAFDFWQTQLAGGEPFCAANGTSTSECTSLHGYLVSAVKSAVHGTPDEVPAAYAARSPAGSLATLAVPIMIFQGTYDYAIDPTQACTKRALLHPRAWYLDASLRVQDPPSPCGGGFETAPLPTTFPDTAYLFFYEGQGHGFTSDALQSAAKLAMPFLLDRLE